jgi:hypothetical protein
MYRRFNQVTAKLYIMSTLKTDVKKHIFIDLTLKCRHQSNEHVLYRIGKICQDVKSIP